MTQSLVSAHWLKDNMNCPNIRIIDASWHLPDSGKNGYVDYLKCHIKNAVFFDIDIIVDEHSSLPHMLPSEEKFSKAMNALGINNDHHIIVYDSSPLHSSMRLWWMLKVFGHNKVSYMDGGLSKWLHEQYPVTSDVPTQEVSEFSSKLQPALIRSATDIFENIHSKKEQLIDARASGRFYSKISEPRLGLRSGHIPNSINIPFFELFDVDGTLLDTEELLDIFTEAGTDLNRPIITSCGSGVTACALMFALKLIGKEDVSVYDGSWSEWGGLPNAVAPIVTCKEQ